MEEQGRRRSDRISLPFRIRVSGVDVGGQHFTENTQTLVVSRHGAKIKLTRGLQPLQEIVVRCLATGRETTARVIGQAGVSAEGYAYGIELLDPKANIWGISFPPATSDDEPAGGRAVLECLSCHGREVVSLNDLELEVFQESERLSRSCDRCRDTTLWGPCDFEPPPQPTAPPFPKPAEAAETPHALEIPPRTQNDRKASRLRMATPICIRTPLYGEDVGTTEDVSRGGLRFKSPRNYTVGSLVEVAIPYTSAGANIFVAARIAWRRELPDFGLVAYGASYTSRLKPSVSRSPAKILETQMQTLKLGNDQYRVFVEFSRQAGLRWQGLVQKNGATVYKENFAAESEAKQKAHRWAYVDAGQTAHVCKEECETWGSVKSS